MYENIRSKNIKRFCNCFLAGFYLIIGVKAIIEGSEGVEMLGTIFWIVCLFTTVGGLLLRKYNQKKEKNDNFGDWKDNA